MRLCSSRADRRALARRPHPYRPQLEMLEGRCLPSTVTNLNDGGPGSLRQAILDTPAGGTVGFQGGLSGTITLTTGELLLNKDLTIAGPGANVITVSGNHASRVFNITAGFAVSISGLTIANGQVASGQNGGGIINAGTLALTYSTLNSNAAASGGGVANTGTLTITGSSFTGNSASSGAAIDNEGMLTVTRSTVSGNTAFINGGGIGSTGTMTILDSTFSRNVGLKGNGGSISTFGGVASVTGSVIENSSAEANGGGFYTFAPGTGSITDCTISGNTAGGPGGGISAFGAVTLTGSTVSGNTGDIGGGITGGPITIRNTIVAGNTAYFGDSPDVHATLNSQGHNVIGNSQGGSGYAASDLLNVNPLLGPLQDNGGLTFTMALLPGSPAIDAGDPTGAPLWDQRGPGYPRLVNGNIDIGAYEHQLVPYPFAVTNTDDTGPGSLRQAILNANGSPDPVTIIFDIRASGPQTIAPFSPLPALTTPTILDGTSQRGYAGQPLIVLDGSRAGAGADGLTITAGHSTVQGLAITNFGGAGIHLESVDGDLITTDDLGTDATGTLSRGNGVGVFIDGTSDNTIGGTAFGAGNVIAGNTQAGVAITGSHNLVEGNRIGTDATGTLAVSNGTGVVIAYIGSDNTIGGTAPGAGNLLSGNRQDAVAIDGGSGNRVEGSSIGTNVSGTVALPNRFGIELLSGSAHSIVGGTAPGAGNVIAGNQRDGIGIYSNDNLVEGNSVGTDAAGRLVLGNGRNGIAVHAAEYGNDSTIGGTAPGAGNVVANNGRDGVLVDTGTGNALQENSIFGNAGLGIELRNGGNQDQAAPSLTSATSDSGRTTVAGTLTGAPNTAFTLEFFANPVCDPSGFGQGERFLGAVVVATDGSGQASFTAVLGVGVDPSQFVTATATDLAGNTSEFSNCVAVSMPSLPGGSTAPLIALGPGAAGFQASAAWNPGMTSTGPSTGEAPSAWGRLAGTGFMATEAEETLTARPAPTGGTSTPGLPVVAPHALDVVLEGFADLPVLDLLGAQ